MKLSMSLLARRLESWHPECHILADRRTIRGVRFLSDQQKKSSDEYVYLGAAADYYQDPRYQDALLLVSGSDQILVHGTDYEELLNEVLASFDYYNSVEQRLYSAAADHQPIRVMLDVVGEMLDSPCLVFDLEGVLLACVHRENLKEKELIENLAKNNRIGSDILGQSIVDSSGIPHHDLADYPEHLHIRNREGHGCVNMYLSQNGERIGFIMFFAVSELEVRCEMTIEQELAGYIAQADEFTDPQSAIRSSHVILNDLLTGLPQDEQSIRKLDTMMGEQGSYILIAYRNLAIRNYTMYTMMRSEWERRDPNCLVTVLDNRAFLFLAEKDLEMMVARMKLSYPEHNLVLGISMPVTDLRDLPLAYRQAIFALEVSPEAGIRRCGDLAMDYLLGRLSDDSLSMSLIHPSCIRLKRLDEENGTELFRTLAAYLRCGCRQTDAAEALHIHLNTLKYRLHRIEDLTGIDWKDARQMFYIRLSVEMMQHEENEKRKL